MFIGHFALGYAAKKATPRTSLATLFLAAQLADILWPILLAVGLEHVDIVPAKKPIPLDFISYPYSHSLLMLVVWGALFAAVYFARSKSAQSAAIIFALVLSHWLLDWLTHVPDMPVWPGGPKYGFGLWNYPIPEMILELAMFAAGAWIYSRSTRARDWRGKLGFWVLVLLFIVSFFANQFGGAPPSVKAIWITGIVGTVVTLVLAWWSDSHRYTDTRSGDRHDTGSHKPVRASGRG